MLADIKEILLEVISLAKHGIGIGAVGQIFAMLGQVKSIIAEAPAVLPEIKDLDGQEAGKLAEASYDLVKSMIQAILK
jgi:hypothetical protein